MASFDEARGGVGQMEELVGWLIGIVIVAALIFFAVAYALAAVFCLLVVIGWLVMVLGDHAVGAGALPMAPWIPWAIAGGLLGAALGFWTMAPVYGLKKKRPLIVAAPVVIIFCLACFGGVTQYAGASNQSSGYVSSATYSPPKASSVNYRKFSLTGTWKGKHGNSISDAILKLKQATVRPGIVSYTGTITGTNSGKHITLAIAATFNQNNGEVSLTETSVSSGFNWTLGQNTGSIAASGRAMSGTGNDHKNPVYSWSFAKE